MSNIEPKCSYPECGPACRKDCPPAASTTIEPTEEQRAAAIRLWSRAGPTGYGMAAAVEDIARLLAEREAKLREEMATLNANNDQLVRDLKQGGLCYPASNVARFILHDRRESSGDWYDPATRRILHMDPAKAFAMKDEVDTLRARVAELEAELAEVKADFATERERVDEWKRAAARTSSLNFAHKKYLEQEEDRNTRLKVDLKAASEREAQHLADIKALKDDAFHRHVACVGGCSVCDLNSGARCSLLQRLAHYDDAKADAPAGPVTGIPATEEERCTRCLEPYSRDNWCAETGHDVPREALGEPDEDDAKAAEGGEG